MLEASASGIIQPTIVLLAANRSNKYNSCTQWARAGAKAGMSESSCWLAKLRVKALGWRLVLVLRVKLLLAETDHY